MLEHPYSWSNPDTPIEKRGELHEKGFIFFTLRGVSSPLLSSWFPRYHSDRSTVRVRTTFQLECCGKVNAKFHIRQVA